MDDLLDRILLEWSWRSEKGYPDISNEKDLKTFENIFGFNPLLSEINKLPYSALTDKGKEIAQELINLLGITQNQIIPASSKSIVIYDQNRELLFDKIEKSGLYGTATQMRTGNWKKDGITIILKPTGVKSGEFFELKPNQLGITLEKPIPLSQLRQELTAGIQKNSILSDVQKKALLYAIEGTDALTDDEKEELSKENKFFNEVNKNFGESHSALLYGLQVGAHSVSFPLAGNYPLIDYLLYKEEEVIQVSVKADKTIGNTVKYGDIVKLVDKVNGTIPPNIRELANIITTNTVTTGAFEAIDKLGSQELKNAVQDYKKKYPQYPNLGRSPQERQARADRISIERDFIRFLNNDTSFNFDNLFNNYMRVKYVKYFLDPDDLKGIINVTETGDFKTEHRTKNSPGHDSDKIGLSVSKK